MVVQPEIRRCATEHNSGQATALHSELTAAAVACTQLSLSPFLMDNRGTYGVPPFRMVYWQLMVAGE